MDLVLEHIALTMVVIRLAPGGKKHSPVYRITVADQDCKLRGRFLERVGIYKPGKTNGFLKIEKDRYDFWVSKGAIPTERVQKLVKDNQKVAK